MKKLIDYIKSAYAELKKVAWPTRKQTRVYTLVVIAMTVGVAIFFGVLDYIFNFVLGLLV